MKNINLASADEESFERTEDTSIKWIKQQWRTLMEIQERSNRKKGSARYSEDLSYLYQGPWHCSNYLDLLALSKEVELKMQSICLRGYCPFIMEPTSTFLQFWLYVNLAAGKVCDTCCVYLPPPQSPIKHLLLLVMIQSIIIPYQISFNKGISPSAFMWCFGLDGLYFLDVYFTLSTAIKKTEVLIDKSSLILLERLKDVYFVIDVIATIPIDYFILYFTNRRYTASLLKLNRLLKMNEVSKQS